MEHTEAVEMIRKTNLNESEKMDLYEIYLEDAEEYSPATAIEKLGTMISDATSQNQLTNKLDFTIQA